jgi:hypothetical protein
MVYLGQAMRKSSESTKAALNNAFDASDIKCSPNIDVKKLVRKAIKGLQKAPLEILPGFAKVLRLMSRIAPT